MTFKKYSPAAAALISLDPIQSLFDQINAEGWEINNFFQIAGGWRVNARRTYEHKNCEYADAETAAEAVAGCLRNIREPRNRPNVLISPKLEFKWELSVQQIVNEIRYRQ